MSVKFIALNKQKEGIRLRACDSCTVEDSQQGLRPSHTACGSIQESGIRAVGPRIRRTACCIGCSPAPTG